MQWNRAALRTHSRKGGGHTDDLIQNLKDADCKQKTIEEVCQLYDSGQIQDAVKTLRKHRCSLMESLHESQEKVDCLDFLVWRMEKEKR